MSFAETSMAEQGKQPYKYGGKELDMMNGLNIYDNLARLYDPAIGRTLTPDPLCENYYSISPYAWCGNNPVNAVDADGLATYFLYGDGRMLLAKADQTDEERKKPDIIYAAKTGEKNTTTVDWNKSVNVTDKSLLPQLAGMEKTSASAETSNSSDAFNVFKFAADNSNVEWSLSGFKDEGKTKFYINTQQSETYSETGESNGVFKAKDMLFNVHSHSKPNGTKGGSGYNYGGYDIKTGKAYLTGYYDDTDASMSNNLYNSTSKVMPLYVYHRYSQGLYKYTPWSSAERSWLNIKTGTRLKNIIYPNR